MDLRLEIFCRMFPRLLDFGAPLVDVFHGVVKKDLAPDALSILRSRLGSLNIFDGLHLEVAPHNRFHLDLSARDDHMKMDYILHMANKEPGENMIDVDWTGAIRSTHSESVSGFYIPGTWSTDLPRHGIVTVTYVCPHPEDARPAERLSETMKRFGWLVSSCPTIQDLHTYHNNEELDAGLFLDESEDFALY